MSNGEQCERLWSYMRCFSSITREMTASHRQDCLTDGLLYYAQKTLMRIGMPILYNEKSFFRFFQYFVIQSSQSM